MTTGLHKSPVRVTIVFALSAFVTACASTSVLPRQEAPVSAWTPQTPFPPPEGDLAYVRNYAAANRWTYAPDQERVVLLQMFHWRAERQRFPGYVQVWGDGGRYHVNMKPPYDRQAMIALASPELRPLLIVHDVSHTLTEIEVLRRRLTGLLESLSGVEWGMSHNYRTDRFDVTIVGEGNAAALRRLLPSELAQMTDITLGRSPLISF